jgi:5-methyltetrahydropteroyltriglutamate--homocysteine methyltransferase
MSISPHGWPPVDLSGFGASKFTPLDQICLSPPSGFASTLRGNDHSHEGQFAKLQLVVETARDVWG